MLASYFALIISKSIIVITVAAIIAAAQSTATAAASPSRSCNATRCNLAVATCFWLTLSFFAVTKQTETPKVLHSGNCV